MTHRYYVAARVVGSRVTLSGPEAHHLLHVMREPVGARVRLFDGSGAEFEAEVAALSRASVELAIIGREEIDRELGVAVTLGVALPKQDHARWLVEKLTEIGVARLVPLVTERSVARPTANVLARLGRTVVEASKQCGRNRLLEILPAAEWLDYVRAPAEGAHLLLADPQAAVPVGSALAQTAGRPPGGYRLAIGPEGGFAPHEVTAAVAAGWTAVSLGARVLRVETAAICLAGAVAVSIDGGRPS